jgi:hypothetical protein
MQYSSTSTMATGSDQRPRDPFGVPLGVRIHNRKSDVLENTPKCTSDEKTPLGRILRNSQLRMRTPFHNLRVTFGHYGVTFHNVKLFS